MDDTPAQDEGGYLLLLKDIADAVAETASLEGALAAPVVLGAADWRANRDPVLEALGEYLRGR